MRSLIVSLLATCLFGIVHALSASGNRLLVVIDDLADKDKYSKFFSGLQGQGFQLTYSTPKSDPALFIHGERNHDHLLLFPSKLKALGPALTANLILDFLKTEGNIMLALSANTPTPTSLISLLLELDIHLPSDRSTVVVDHFNYDSISAKEKHDVLLLPHPAPLRADVKNYFGGEGLIAFPYGVAQTLGPQSPLLAPILRAPQTAYTHNPKEDSDGTDEIFASGKQASLISTVQARNSARFTVLGSAEMLEDVWTTANVQLPADKKQSKTANLDFVKKVAQWAFKEVGVLQVGKVEHWLNEKENYVPSNDTGREMQRMDINPTMYRIKNDVTFSIEISEHTPDGPTPFSPPTADAVQLEFTMLSPYHRIPLNPISSTPTSTIFGTTFKVPDQHGIFSFRVNYKRPFLTSIEEKHHVTVRHFAHDEWPRSFQITGAYVWVVGVWATVAGWLAFVAVWLFCEPTDKKAKAKKTQ